MALATSGGGGVGAALAEMLLLQEEDLLRTSLTFIGPTAINPPRTRSWCRASQTDWMATAAVFLQFSLGRQHRAHQQTAFVYAHSWQHSVQRQFFAATSVRPCRRGASSANSLAVCSALANRAGRLPSQEPIRPTPRHRARWSPAGAACARAGRR